MIPKPFIIYALPRSRTYWLSKFLTYGDWHCGHDIVIDLHSLSNLKKYYSAAHIGSVETGMVDGWKVMERLVPGHKRVVVHRPVAEVRESLSCFNVTVPDGYLEAREEKLLELARQPNVLFCKYHELDEEKICKDIFEFCLNTQFDKNWWLSLRDKNIQIDMDKNLKRLVDNRLGINALKNELRMTACA